MKYCLFALICTLFYSVVPAQQYTPVNTGTTISFKIKNFGFTVDGSFSGIKGAIEFAPDDLAKASFEVTIDAASINTDNTMRDNHLREESYFDVKNHPLIRFVSTRVSASNKKGIFLMFGKLTIKDHTQELSFPFSASSMAEGYQFDGEFKINRRDFKVGGSSTLSDNVVVTLRVFAKK